MNSGNFGYLGFMSPNTTQTTQFESIWVYDDQKTLQLEFGRNRGRFGGHFGAKNLVGTMVSLNANFLLKMELNRRIKKKITQYLFSSSIKDKN